MGLSSFCFIVGFFTKGQEFVQHLYRFLEIAKDFMNSTNFLAALSFLILIFRFFRGSEASFKELESFIKISLVLELDSNDLIHSY